MGGRRLAGHTEGFHELSNPSSSQTALLSYLGPHIHRKRPFRGGNHSEITCKWSKSDETRTSSFKVCFHRRQLQNILTVVLFHTSLLPFSLTQFFTSSALFQRLWLFFPRLQTARPEVVGAGSRAGTQLGVVGVCLCTRLWVRKSVRLYCVCACV